MATTAPARPGFRRLSEIGEWSKDNQSTARRFALHLDLSAAVIKKTLRQGAAKGSLMDRATANWKAARAVRNYSRAAAHLDAAADCIGKGWNDILEQFHELIEPKPVAGSFDWKG